MEIVIKKLGTSGLNIPDGVKALLGELFRHVGVPEGTYTLNMTQDSCRGKAAHQGLGGVTVRQGNKSDSLAFTVQPGDNTTRRRYILNLPNGQAEKFLPLFNKVEAPPPAPRTIAEIDSDISGCSQEIEELPDHSSDLGEIDARVAQIKAERDKLDRELSLLATRRQEVQGKVAVAEERRVMLMVEIEDLTREKDAIEALLADGLGQQIAAFAVANKIDFDAAVRLLQKFHQQ